MRIPSRGLLHFLAGVWATALCPLLGAALTPSSQVASWTHTSFDDFRAGAPGNSGHNLYVSRDGRVQTIRRFDLNQDGYLDLSFNGTHDWYTHIPASLAEVGTDRTVAQTGIGVLGSSRVFVRDLNRDGHPDLVFHPNHQNLQHERTFFTVVWGGKDGWPDHRATRLLPVNDSYSAAMADLDEDGWLDIISLNSVAWLPGQPPGRIVRIFWGGPDGPQLFRYLDIGIPNAMEIATGDFDGNGFEDLAVVATNGVVRIFWSTPGAEKSGTLQEGEVTLKAGQAAGPVSYTRAGNLRSSGEIQTLAAGDINHDAKAELIAGTSTGELLLVGFDGRQPRAVLTVPAFNASQITVGDADADGWPDLVFTDLKLSQAMGGEAAGARKDSSAPVVILWGGDAGFDRARATSLSIPQAIATAIGDYDGDGKPDLAVAVHQGETTMTAQSQIQFGEGNRRFRAGSGGITTHGAIHPATIPGRNGGRDRVVFCNSLGGTLGEAIPLFFYWGGKNGFAADRVWKLPFRSGYKSLAADLSADGHVDLIVMNSGHAGPEISKSDPELGAHVYWGGKDGEAGGPNKFDRTRRTIFRETELGGSNVADLNRDGYLDLILGAFEDRSGAKAQLVIQYGSAEGLAKGRRVSIENEDRTIGCLVADVDRDGWLDIAVAAMNVHKVTIYFGGAEGFSADRKRDLIVAAPLDLESADLNRDGWLDLIVSSYWDPVSHNSDVGLTIFWGGTEGYQPSNAQWLPGWTPIGIAVADLDADGYLDIVSPHYHAEITREDVPSYLYWGSAQGYSTKNRTSLTVDSAHDVLIGDFNGDRRLDLAFSAHSSNNGHWVTSPIFYNDGKHFAHPEVQRLPTVGSHFMSAQDIGNLADRSFTESYDSAVLSWNAPVRRGRIEAAAEIPAGARLDLQIRSAPEAAVLKTADWQAVPKGAFTVGDRDRVLQYRALFVSPNGDRFPILDSVSISISR